MSFIPCLNWVNRGVAKSNPEWIQLSASDLEIIRKSSEQPVDDSHCNLYLDDEDERSSGNERESALGAGSGDGQTSVPKNNSTKRMKTEPTSDDENELSDKTKKVLGSKIGSRSSNEEFPIAKEGSGMKKKKKKESDSSTKLNAKVEIKVKNGIIDEENESSDAESIDEKTTEKKEEWESDSDNEDFNINDSDNLIVVGRVSHETGSLEVHVYNSELNNFFIHHDILLSSYPMAVEPIRRGVSEGNFVAVGLMDPVIEIWDLDILNPVEPHAALDASKVSQPKKKKKAKKFKLEDFGMGQKAVISLAHNPVATHVLAAGMADFALALWDLQNLSLANVVKGHSEKVQSLMWHPCEQQILLSGCADKKARVFDCSSMQATHKGFQLDGEVECVRWNPFNPAYFLASSDHGSIYYFDIRSPRPVTVQEDAHDGSVTALDFSSSLKTCFASVSTDEHIQVWDVVDNSSLKSVYFNKLPLGQIHCVGACPDNEFVFTAGGEHENVHVWDIRNSDSVRKYFGIKD